MIQADRHVVLVSFGSYAVEVAPVFLLTDGSYWICDTSGLGRYKVANPIAEAEVYSSGRSGLQRQSAAPDSHVEGWQKYCRFRSSRFIWSWSPRSFWRRALASIQLLLVRLDYARLLRVPRFQGFDIHRGSRIGRVDDLGAEWQSRALTAWTAQRRPAIWTSRTSSMRRAKSGRRSSETTSPGGRDGASSQALARNASGRRSRAFTRRPHSLSGSRSCVFGECLHHLAACLFGCRNLGPVQALGLGLGIAILCAGVIPATSSLSTSTRTSRR